MIHPELLSVGILHIRWYGVMAACGVVSAYWLMLKRRTRYGFSQENVSDMTFWGMVAAIVGARLLYVVRFWDEQFAAHPADALKIYEGGLVFLGGFALSAVCLAVFCRLKHWKLGRVSDLIAPALPLGHAFGRMGCFLNGCCFGFRYDGFCSVRYEYPPYGTFPLQLLAALCNLILALGLLWLERRGTCRNRLFLAYALAYSVGRFVLEFGRGDYPAEQLWHGLTPAQVTCLWMGPLVVAVWLLLRFLPRRNEK